jgi:hypothetical protein
MKNSARFHVPAALIPYQLDWRLGGPQNSLDDMEEGKMSDPERNRTPILGRRVFTLVWDAVGFALRVLDYFSVSYSFLFRLSLY